ncbi:putative amidophosphoribosyltransferase [Methylophilaceae bacterium 11]|nr:putative amidophosphoribosyltransferase [Methylophilaceae bacterium 11]
MFNIKPFFNQFMQPTCILCEAKAHHTLGICADCWQNLPWQALSGCPQCGLPAAGNTCGSCLTDPPFFDATHALFEYAYPIDALLQALKYQHALHLARLFAAISLKHVSASDVDCVLPMPMHPARIQQRGFNQSLELAKRITKLLHKPLATHHCQRIRNTPPQASLPLKSRVSNIKAAFTCDDYFVGKHVAIVDDVMTSGASLNELAKTLKAAGAAKVTCWVMARTY